MFSFLAPAAAAIAPNTDSPGVEDAPWEGGGIAVATEALHDEQEDPAHHHPWQRCS